MASKDYAILDIQNDNDELHFQDFGLSGSSSRGNSQTHVFTDFPDSPSHQNDRDKLLGEYQDDEESAPKSSSSSKSQSYWTFEYYQQYFDVDSKQVGDRIMWSMVPKPGVNYLELHIRPKPDLYGPFWVCLTLVFAAAIAGNVSNYLQTHGDQSQHWRYDFHKVSLAAGMVFSYGWLLPLLLWAGLRYKSSKPPLSLLDLICLYGYSLSVLVPVCLVWTAPIVWLRWCVGIVGVVLSGVVLTKAVWEGLKGGGQGGDFVEEDDSSQTAGGVMKKVAMVVVLVVVVMHVAIAMGFMLYFFSEPVGGAQLQGVPGAALPLSALPVNAQPTVLPAAATKDIVPTKRDLTHAGPAHLSGGGGPAAPDAIKASQPDSSKLNAPAALKQPEVPKPASARPDTAQKGFEVQAAGLKNPPVKESPVEVADKLPAVSNTEKRGSPAPKQEAVPKFDLSKVKEIPVDSDTRISPNKLDTTAGNGAQVAAVEPVVAEKPAVANNKGRPVRSEHRKIRKANT